MTTITDKDKETIKKAFQAADRIPELNPANYNHDDVMDLNDHAIDAGAQARAALALLSKLEEEQHPDDAAVDRFAVAMKAKLAKKRDEGRGGWSDPDVCAVEWLSTLLHRHVPKGDPVDVANFCMMLHQRGSGILPPEEDKEDGRVRYQSKVSGLWYENPAAAGDICAVSVAATVFIPGSPVEGRKVLAMSDEEIERLISDAEQVVNTVGTGITPTWDQACRELLRHLRDNGYLSPPGDKNEKPA